MSRFLETNVHELSDAELDKIAGGQCVSPSPPFSGNGWRDLSAVLGGVKGLDTLADLADIYGDRC